METNHLENVIYNCARRNSNSMAHYAAKPLVFNFVFYSCISFLPNVVFQDFLTDDVHYHFFSRNKK